MIEYYDCNFTRLECNYTNNIPIFLPNKIIVRLSNVVESEIVKVTLCGLKFSQESLLKILEYRPCKYMLKSYHDLTKFPSQITTKCNKDGYYVFNFFNKNPFAIHLYTQNTIPFTEVNVNIL